MYRVGQAVVHPMHGAGIIENMIDEMSAGAARAYYVFRSRGSGLVLKLPVDNCAAIGIREPATPERVQSLVADIPALAVEEDRNWSRRYRENMERLKSGDLTEVARVVKALMHRDARRGLSTGERKMLRSAKQILLSEIALVQQMAYDAAERWIDEVMMTGAVNDGKTV